MLRIKSSRQFLSFVLLGLTFFLADCGNSADGRYYGKTEAPNDRILRYISGSEPESIDPQIPTGQPEARVVMALYDGLVEYHPKTMEPIPAIAESWEVNKAGTEYLFHLRKNAKFSNGDPITAKDFVYTLRRGLSPELAAQNAYLAYYIKYGEAYNGGKMFVKDDKGQFLLRKNFEDDFSDSPAEAFGADTDFRRIITAPERLTVDGDGFTLAKSIEGDDKLKPFFRLHSSDLKDASNLVGKIKSGNDGIAQLLRSKLGNTLENCVANCSDVEKQSLIDGINQILTEESLQTPENTNGIKLSETAAKLIQNLDTENKKISDANKKLDDAIALADNSASKDALAARRRKPITKLFYLNRLLLESFYPDGIEAMSLVPVKAEDIGVESVDDYTLRLTLSQPAPFFIGLLPHQFFRVVHQATIEKFKKEWTKQENIVTSGAFTLKAHLPYDKLVMQKNPDYWDAANVKLDGLEFFTVEDATTMMNLYQANLVYALYNHVVPAAWYEKIANFKDEYLNLPEVGNDYYTIDVKKAPMDNVKVRQAFSLAVDRDALAKFRRTAKPLYSFVPEGILTKYDDVRTRVFTEQLKEKGISAEDWSKRKFDPEQARKLLKDAGFTVEKNGDELTCPGFPIDKVSVTYNTLESNKAIAEFLQAQWKQNLGITVPLQNMEWKTFLPLRKAVDYQGFARGAWSGDYMDPYTFLNLFYHLPNDSSTGWSDPKYDAMLDAANKELDPQKRFEILAKAEFFLLQNQPVVPLMTPGTNWLKKPFVKGLYPNPGTVFAWKFAYIETDPSKWDTDVENIMTKNDPIVEAQLNQLISTQKSIETNQKNGN